MAQPTARDDDAPLQPFEMLDLAQWQQRSVGAQLGAHVPLVLMAWCLAWCGSFVVLFLDDTVRTAHAAPSLWALLVAGGLLIAAISTSALLGIRASRGIGASDTAALTGIVYGNLWWLGGATIALVGVGLQTAGMRTELLWVLYPAMLAVFFGLMFTAAGLIWPAPPMLALGGWMLLVGAVTSFVPAPGHYLWSALAGASGFAAVAVWAVVWIRGAR